MAVTLGLRPGELFALRHDDLEPGRLRIDESLNLRANKTKETKTETSNGFVHLPATLEAELRGWLAVNPGRASDLLFQTAKGTAVSPNNYERDVIVPAAIRAGIMPAPPKEREKGAPRRSKVTAVNFQAFGRTFATWMQKTGATVKDVQTAARLAGDHPEGLHEGDPSERLCGSGHPGRDDLFRARGTRKPENQLNNFEQLLGRRESVSC